MDHVLSPSSAMMCPLYLGMNWRRVSCIKSLKQFSSTGHNFFKMVPRSPPILKLPNRIIIIIVILIITVITVIITKALEWTALSFAMIHGTLMTSQLNPRISLTSESLHERRPLDSAAHFSPRRNLKLLKILHKPTVQIRHVSTHII